jgi:hypothetical protein
VNSWKELSVLPLAEKIQSLYRYGFFVMNIRYYEYKVNLYLIGTDYVEVFFHHKRGRIERILPLDRSHSRMKFYSDQVRLKHLLTPGISR